MRRDQGLVRLIGRTALVLAIAVVAAASVGCQQQQLEERNAALQKQLEQALLQNADLQAESDGLRGQNQQLGDDLARARAAPSPAATAQAGKKKPDFGEGVDVSVVGDVTTVTLPNTILFDSGKATLKASSKKVLDKIATVLNRDYASQKIRVEGHTDNQPIVKSKKLWADNWDLSCNRAMAVLRYLTSKGVDSKRIYAAGYSVNKPVASNSSAAGRAKNRRVAIVVSPR
ncbi:MAG TPA: OmpA family protein [Phycisphaerae bacterium]|nr:OmpA family protein [Phycisphaerae bacterium]